MVIKICSQILTNCKSIEISDDINIFESNLFFNNLPCMFLEKVKRQFFNDGYSFDNLDYNNITAGPFISKYLGRQVMILILISKK